MPPAWPRQMRSAVPLLAAVLALGACAGSATPGAATSSLAPGPASPTSTASPARAPSTSAVPTSPNATASTMPATTPTPGPFDPAGLRVELRPVVGIPGAPLGVAADPSGSGRLFVTERGGRIWTVRDGRLSDDPFLDIGNRVTAGGESGLLGFAPHPRFPGDPRMFVYYTDRDRDQVVSEFRLAPSDPDRADPASERRLLAMDDFAGNHNGGALQFGPDGLLYIATGDGGGAGDPQKTAQRLDTLLGKILRIGVDPDPSGLPYTRPPDNPFLGREGAVPEIWHLGLRNPWRFSFDPATDDLWIGDVGQGGWEEIDVARANAAGLNFGWSIREGRHCFNADSCAMDGLTDPVVEYSHDFGCSVTGGVVYRGSRYPALHGGYLFADYCSGIMWAIDARSDAVEQPTIVAETGRAISSFGEDEAGEVYVTDLAGELLEVIVP